MRHLLIYTILFLIETTAAVAQRQIEDIAQIREAFRRLDYNTTKQKAEAVLESWQQYSVMELLEIHKMLGVIAYTEGDIITSRTHFEHTLTLDFTAELDSVIISPKIINFFHQLKTNFKPQATPPEGSRIHYIMTSRSYPQAILRSILLPGWGQIYKGQKKKGVILLTTTGTSVLSWTTFYCLQKNAHEKYRNATEPNEIESRYRDYNHLYRCQQFYGYITGVFWLVSFVDVIFSPPNQSSHLSFYLQQIDSHFYLTAVWKF